MVGPDTPEPGHLRLADRRRRRLSDDTVLAILTPGVGVRVRQFTLVGELLFLLWLLFKGGNVEEWRRVAEAESAGRG